MDNETCNGGLLRALLALAPLGVRELVEFCAASMRGMHALREALGSETLVGRCSLALVSYRVSHGLI